MMQKEDILQFLEEHKPYLFKKFGVRSIGLFGSYAKDRATSNSDIDIVVDMPPSFDNFFDLKYYLEKHLKAKIDLVREKNLRGFIRNKIQDELLYV